MFGRNSVDFRKGHDAMPTRVITQQSENFQMFASLGITPIVAATTRSPHPCRLSPGHLGSDEIFHGPAIPKDNVTGNSAPLLQTVGIRFLHGGQAKRSISANLPTRPRVFPSFYRGPLECSNRIRGHIYMSVYCFGRWSIWPGCLRSRLSRGELTGDK